jgi:hypothetical protein
MVVAIVALLLATAAPAPAPHVEQGELLAMCQVVEDGLSWPGGITGGMIDAFTLRVATARGGTTVCPL